MVTNVFLLVVFWSLLKVTVFAGYNHGYKPDKVAYNPHNHD